VTDVTRHNEAQREYVEQTVFRALAAAGFGRFRHERFGFFPPFLADQALGSRIERRLERSGPLRPFMPFQLSAAEAS
jgi:hypothetical protein